MEQQLATPDAKRVLLPLVVLYSMMQDEMLNEAEDEMLTITAIIRVRKGEETVMRDGLLDVANHVAAKEPETVGYHISQNPSEPCVFTTYERYANQAAMDRHNNSEAVARFFAIAKPILDGAVTLVTGTEIFTKPDARLSNPIRSREAG